MSFCNISHYWEHVCRYLALPASFHIPFYDFHIFLRYQTRSHDRCNRSPFLPHLWFFILKPYIGLLQRMQSKNWQIVFFNFVFFFLFKIIEWSTTITTPKHFHFCLPSDAHYDFSTVYTLLWWIICFCLHRSIFWFFFFLAIADTTVICIFIELPYYKQFFRHSTSTQKFFANWWHFLYSIMISVLTL